MFEDILKKNRRRPVLKGTYPKMTMEEYMSYPTKEDRDSMKCDINATVRMTEVSLGYGSLLYVVSNEVIDGVSHVSMSMTLVDIIDWEEDNE